MTDLGKHTGLGQSHGPAVSILERHWTRNCCKISKRKLFASKYKRRAEMFSGLWVKMQHRRSSTYDCSEDWFEISSTRRGRGKSWTRWPFNVYDAPIRI